MDSGSKGPRSRPGQINVLSSRERHLTLTKRLPGKTEKMLGGGGGGGGGQSNQQ